MAPESLAFAARPRTLPQTIADALREAIYAGRFPPGARIPQAIVARELGVSQTTVRDAFALLEREGIVERGDRRGATVIRLSREDIEEIVTLRTVLEATAMRRLVRGDTTAVVAELEANLAAMKACRDGRELAVLDLDFHEIIVRGAGNKRLYGCWQGLLPPLKLLMMAHHQQDPNVFDGTTTNHRKLIRLIRANDEANAIALLEGSSDIYLVQLLEPEAGSQDV